MTGIANAFAHAFIAAMIIFIVIRSFFGLLRFIMMMALMTF